MTTMTQRLIHFTAAACAALTLMNTAHAVDLRSWDQKFNQASKRFLVLPAFNGEAVLDKETQLVWHRGASFTPRNWHDSRDICLTSDVGGRAGWRLPTYVELATLFSDGRILLEGHPFANILDNQYFWSATTSSTDGSSAYSLRLSPEKHTWQQSKVANAQRLCVRGAGSPDGG
jgi:hypothetical protein